MNDLNVTAAQLDVAAAAFGWDKSHTELVSGDEIKRQYVRGSESVQLYEDAATGKIVSFSWVDGQNWTAVGEELAGVHALVRLSTLA